MANNSKIKEKITTATYNFIPLLTTVLMKQEDNKHNKICGNTGEIQITLKAETPLFVSDKEDKFFTNANGEKVIPGSSIKGMVRSNMQILGYDKINGDIEDYSIYFRDMASSSSSTNDTLKKYYTTTLGVKSEKVNSDKNKANANKKTDSYTNSKKGGAMVTKAENVESGYIVNENGTYKIYPCEYIRISAKHDELVNEQKTFLTTKDVWFKDNDFTFNENNKKDYMKKGVMLFTGKPVGNKPNSKYIFTEFKNDAEFIEISKEDVLNYNIDYKMRARVNSEGARFWELPKDNDKPKPVFYVHTDNHTYFGMSQFIRIAHSNNISYGIPETHKNNDITFVENILGYTNKGEEENESMASRVYFGDFAAKIDKKHDSFMAVLGEPKPSFFSAYVNEGKHYSENDFKIRGRKKYWLKDFLVPSQTDLKINVATELNPVDAGSVFKGVIKYKNLTNEELGLLLWSLKLEDGCYQSIGKGKSLGMGRVSLTIDKLNKTNEEYSFENFCNPFDENTENVNQYIKEFKTFLTDNSDEKKKNKKPIEERFPIKDFIYMQKTIVQQTEDILDMGLDNKNITNALLTINDLKKKWEESDNTKEGDSGVSGNAEEDSFAALMSKFGGNKKR